MFSTYIHSAYYGFLVFPILALVFTLPYLIVQYRKYGSFLLFRAVVVYSFILYLLCAYFIVILPLPTFAEAAAQTGPIMQLEPLQCLRDILAIPGFYWRDISTYTFALHHPDFWQVVLNGLLLFPLGIYLRYYFKRGFFATLFLGFAVSLFFEVTQITALYGIYPHPYRLFDVDDLILNTAGAVMGFILAPLFCFLFPSREKMDEISYERGEEVSLFRRVFGTILDWGILGILISLFHKILGMETDLTLSFGNVLLYLSLVALYFILLPWILKGYTIGKALVKIRITDQKGKPPKLTQIAIRNGLLYGLILPSLLFAYQLNEYSYTVKESALITFLVGIFAVIFLSSFVYYFYSLTKGKRQFLHEKLSHTQLTSTIKQ